MSNNKLLLTGRRCDYVDIDGGAGSNIFGDQMPISSVGVFCNRAPGWDPNLRCEPGTAGCYPTDEYINHSYNFKPRNLSVATTVMGAAAAVAFLFAAGANHRPVVWMVISAVLLATAVTEGLVYQNMMHNLYCDRSGLCLRGNAANCAIAAMTFWSLSSLICCGLGNAKKAENRKDTEEDLVQGLLSDPDP
ncbi:hypothetical protein THAOC_22037 [Thalassiosira oceanica]|uniref:Uncharacterized protein n=1 Tax=Thalassiosira oceanica TaxID=159749 RepID=K0RXZ4_THAOC|nr:hypothetical protein THAOC_22037 [Thalassiosira oceanica]|eukprot:EJK57880.1 hypothetical protein THAOC_22037 [Thalassiosira oceanica]